MQASVEAFVEQVARRGSWFGGGSVAALCAALAAALLEQLVHSPPLIRRLRMIRRECVSFILRDADTFAGVIKALRQRNRRGVARALKAATEVPCRVFEHAQTVQRACRTAQRSVDAKCQSDLRCAMAVALAAGESARTLIHTNLAWLDDQAYSSRIRRRVQAAGRTDGR